MWGKFEKLVGRLTFLVELPINLMVKAYVLIIRAIDQYHTAKNVAKVCHQRLPDSRFDGLQTWWAVTHYCMSSPVVCDIIQSVKVSVNKEDPIFCNILVSVF